MEFYRIVQNTLSVPTLSSLKSFLWLACSLRTQLSSPCPGEDDHDKWVTRRRRLLSPTAASLNAAGRLYPTTRLTLSLPSSSLNVSLAAYSTPFPSPASLYRRASRSSYPNFPRPGGSFGATALPLPPRCQWQEGQSRHYFGAAPRSAYSQPLPVPQTRGHDIFQEDPYYVHVKIMKALRSAFLAIRSSTNSNLSKIMAACNTGKSLSCARRPPYAQSGCPPRQKNRMSYFAWTVCSWDRFGHPTSDTRSVRRRTVPL